MEIFLPFVLFFKMKNCATNMQLNLCNNKFRDALLTEVLNKATSLHKINKQKEFFVALTLFLFSQDYIHLNWCTHLSDPIVYLIDSLTSHK